MSPADLDIRVGPVDLDLALDVYVASGLGERRPVDDRDRFRAMLDNADLVVTAWDGELLVGIARSITDYAYTTYLSDLAVRRSHQRSGIGKRLIVATADACDPRCRIVLLAAPAAREYYPALGFEQHPSAWILSPAAVSQLRETTA